MNISKSKYTRFCQCPKILWLDIYKREKAVLDLAVERRFEEGNNVGDYAMRYFEENFSQAEVKNADGSLNIPVMLAKTKVLIKQDVETICEAAFQTDGCFCAVDILHKENGGYAIYEVKSSTKLSDVYIQDISFQKYVLEKAGILVTGTYILHVNNKYMRNGKIDIHQLFVCEDVSSRVAEHLPLVPSLINEAKKVCSLKDEPERKLGEYCRAPYECAYWKYCSEEVHSIPSPSVFDLYHISFKNALALYDDGIVTFEDVVKENVDLTEKQQVQILGNDLFEKEYVSAFLSRLSRPLYFLDFETFQTCIPEYDGVKPYQQIPFQYSLHFFDGVPDITLKALRHKEFLFCGAGDPRRELAESLIKDIPDNACIIAYNKGFECGRIKELADAFPDLKDALMFRREHFYDLLDVFKNGYVYKKSMGGSFSIKSVLPALFPNDPEKDYHNLEDVHNGQEAASSFLELRDKSTEEKERLRRNLLKYCEKDTMAMVWIWQWLVKKVNGKI